MGGFLLALVRTFESVLFAQRKTRSTKWMVERAFESELDALPALSPGILSQALVATDFVGEIALLVEAKCRGRYNLTDCYVLSS